MQRVPTISNACWLFILTLLIEGCGPSGGKEKTSLKSGVLHEYMDTTIKAGDDFHRFVNGTWLRNTEIPDDKASFGIGIILHEQAEDNVRSIVEESAEGNYEAGSDEQMVGDLYRSYMDMENRNKLGIAPLQDEFEIIDEISDHDGLARYFARAVKLGFECPLSLGIFPDFKEPDKYSLYYFQSGLGLPEREYYLAQDDRSVELREKYLSQIELMLSLAGVPDPRVAASNIMNLETRLAENHMKKEEARDLRLLYNNFPVDSLPAIMPKFNWTAFFEEAEIPNTSNLIVAMVDYSTALDGIISSTGLDIWKQYLKWTYLNANDTYLSEEVDNQNFEFYGKTLYGIQQQRPLWRRAISFVNQNLGEVVGKVYVQRHFPPEAKARMSQLVENLITAYEMSIKELDWMSDSTKAEALDKLSKFTPKIGYPDIWKDYSGLEIKRNDLLGNKLRASLSDYRREIDKLDGPVQKHEWQMNPQTVNAYYDPTKNEIVFPAAILQPPYFDMNAEDAVNYGAIGAIIGHEIGHGFDDKGSTFDGNGQMRNWWTKNDRQTFEDRTEALVDQYDQFRVFDDLNVNGEFTLGENIGDLGGLSIALQAYELSLNGNEAPVMDGFSGEQRVFIGYAQSWRGKVRDEALRVRVNTDPHSPAEFRVNGVVRNIPEFYEAFNVTQADSLFLPSDKRVKIW